MKYEDQLKSFQPQHENSITCQNHSGITLVSPKASIISLGYFLKFSKIQVISFFTSNLIVSRRKV